ncbi:MAG: hypothetical protein Q8L73_09060 [Methylotenera sp.]|nr:hypothetical protein [Methylotenera sp.]
MINRRVIFCANQVSLCIATTLVEKEKAYINTTVFFDRLRCDTNVFRKLEIDLIHFSKWNFIKFLFKSFFIRPNEVCVPHFKGGRLIRVYAKYAKRISAIDDGLDTFREIPKNIVVSDFKHGSNYYTFKYDFPLATWLQKFNIVRVCELGEIAKSCKEILELNDFEVVLIESPGIEIVSLADFEFAKLLLVKHSNPNKNRETHMCFPSVAGSDFALEKSLKNFRGTIVVGESMTAVYSLMLKSPAFKLVVAIQDDNKKNLVSLVQLLNIKKHAMLWHAGYNIFDVKNKIVK